MGIVGSHAGLALATALAGYINAGLLFYQLRKQKIYLPLKQKSRTWLKEITRIIVATAIMALAILLLKPSVSWWQQAELLSKVSSLLSLVAVAIVVYFTALFLMGLRKHHILSI